MMRTWRVIEAHYDRIFSEVVRTQFNAITLCSLVGLSAGLIFVLGVIIGAWIW